VVITAKDRKFLCRTIVALPVIVLMLPVIGISRWLYFTMDTKFDAVMDWAYGDRSWRYKDPRQ
jgi:hypothetical protein